MCVFAKKSKFKKYSNPSAWVTRFLQLPTPPKIWNSDALAYVYTVYITVHITVGYITGQLEFKISGWWFGMQQIVQLFKI